MLNTRPVIRGMAQGHVSPTFHRREGPIIWDKTKRRKQKLDKKKGNKG